MKKGPNSEASPRNFSLPKNKILRGRANFQRLFSRKAIIFQSNNVLIRFRVYFTGETDYKMAFIVPKRLGKAVKRNRVKRLLRESYRLNQFIIADEAAAASCIFHGAFMAKTVDVEYDDVKPDVIGLLNQVQEYLRKKIE